MNPIHKNPKRRPGSHDPRCPKREHPMQERVCERIGLADQVADEHLMLMRPTVRLALTERGDQ